MTSRSKRIITTILGVFLIVIVIVDVALIVRKKRYEAEEDRLRSNMTEFERLTADALVNRERERSGVMFELLRRQALGDPDLHLSILIDSSAMILERSNAQLRLMTVQIGGEVPVDSLPGARMVAIPRGTRTFEQFIEKGDSYLLPEWVWEQRGLAVPESRDEPSFLDRGAFVMTGGTLVYALPSTGPLSDSNWVMPGTIRVSQDDLEAIKPNLVRGTKIYLF